MRVFSSWTPSVCAVVLIWDRDAWRVAGRGAKAVGAGAESGRQIECRGGRSDAGTRQRRRSAGKCSSKRWRKDKSGNTLPDPVKYWYAAPFDAAGAEQTGEISFFQPGEITVGALIGSKIGYAHVVVSKPASRRSMLRLRRRRFLLEAVICSLRLRGIRVEIRAWILRLLGVRRIRRLRRWIRRDGACGEGGKDEDSRGWRRCDVARPRSKL